MRSSKVSPSLPIEQVAARWSQLTGRHYRVEDLLQLVAQSNRYQHLHLCYRVKEIVTTAHFDQQAQRIRNVPKRFSGQLFLPSGTAAEILKNGTPKFRSGIDYDTDNVLYFEEPLIIDPQYLVIPDRDRERFEMECLRATRPADRLLKLQTRVDELEAENQELKIRLASTTPPYLDPEHIHYPLELAVAVELWLACYSQGSSKFGVRAILRKWLATHYPKLSGEAVERISSVANWNKKGGAPRSDEISAPPPKSKRSKTSNKKTSSKTAPATP